MRIYAVHFSAEYFTTYRSAYNVAVMNREIKIEYEQVI